MKKWFSSKESKKITVIILILCVVLIAQIIGFSSFNQKLYDISLEYSTDQVTELSVYMEKALQLELERHVHMLQVVAAHLEDQDTLRSDEITRLLEDTQDIFNFRMMGFSDLNGQGMDAYGHAYNITYEHIREHIEQDEVYISNVLKNGNETLIFVAVPLKNRDEIRGILWGKYPLSDLVETLEFTNNPYKYIQIIDDQGNYLLSFNNKFAFNQNPQFTHQTIWDELERYHYADGITSQDIYESVQRGESGTFYFEGDGQGGYVNYRPLSINNWYLFSVQVDEGLHSYVNNIRKHSLHFHTLLTIGLVTIFGVIYNLIYSMYKRIANQNQKIQTINVVLHSTLQQTKSTPFTVDYNLKQIVLYGYPTRDVIQCCSFEDMQPDNMLKKGLLDVESLPEYQKLYESLFVQQKKCDPVIIHSQIRSKKEWIRVSITSDAAEGSDQMIGVLENYEEQKKKDLQIETHLDDIRKIEERSQIDFLTKLYNRETFLKKVQAALEENQRIQQQDALLILDLDHFKQVNDCMGHGMGDIVLQKTADTLHSFFRTDDIVGRLGGDEFVVYAQNIQNIQAFELRIQQLLHLLCKTYHKDGHSVQIGASIGIMLTNADHASFDLLYEKADQALYQVKQEGRNGYRIYSDHK